MRWGKTTLRWVEYQQGTWPSPQKAKQPDLGRSRGGARGAQLPLIFGPTEARRVKKKIFLRPPPPLSEGIDMTVVCMEKCTYPFLGRASILNFDYSVKYNGCVTNCVVLKFPFGYYSYYNHMIQNLQLKLPPTLLETEVFRKKALNVINCNSFTISFNTVLYCRIIC